MENKLITYTPRRISIHAGSSEWMIVDGDLQLIWDKVKKEITLENVPGNRSGYKLIEKVELKHNLIDNWGIVADIMDRHDVLGAHGFKNIAFFFRTQSEITEQDVIEGIILKRDYTNFGGDYAIMKKFAVTEDHSEFISLIGNHRDETFQLASCRFVESIYKYL